MPDQSLIERVARAISGADGAFTQAEIETARAVLTSMREPTARMCKAPLGPWREGFGPAVLYRIMIDAALDEAGTEWRNA
jgi:hypothetical protein